MKRLTQAISEAVLALAVLPLLALVIIPWKDKPMVDDPGVRRVPPAASPRQAEPPSRTREPGEILPLFIGRETPRSSAPPAPRRERTPPTEAPWLRYLGRSSGTDGAPRYFLKDTRSGRVLTVTAGGGSAGWALVEEQGARIVLENDGALYVVSTR